MLTVKHLTLFKPKHWKKAGIFFTKVAREIELCLFFFNANINIDRVMDVFFPQPLKKCPFIFFRQSDPQEESKCKNAQFLQWILNDDVYFKKITASWIWGNSFIMKNIGFFAQYAAATILRHWATMI